MTPEIPTGRPIFKGEIATYWFDDGVLISLSKSPKRTVENISGNVALVKEIPTIKECPCLFIYQIRRCLTRKQGNLQPNNYRLFILQWQWFQSLSSQNSL